MADLDKSIELLVMEFGTLRESIGQLSGDVQGVARDVHRIVEKVDDDHSDALKDHEGRILVLETQRNNITSSVAFLVAFLGLVVSMATLYVTA